jgi:hypothetical protein
MANHCRYLLPALFLLMSSCVERKAVVVTVQLGANLNNVEVTKLRLVLYQNQESGFADFDNGAPIAQAVTLSTRIDEARFGLMNIGVVALDATGRSVGGGNAQVNVDGTADVQVQISVDALNPCAAGDGADAGCCLNGREDDDVFSAEPRGLIDCQEDACEQATPICQGECGDGDVQFYRGELCDGDDSCDSSCVSLDESLNGFVRYVQVAENNVGEAVSLLGSFSIQGARGFFGGISDGDCRTAGFSSSPVAFDLASNGDMGALQLVDELNTVIESINTASAGFNNAQFFATSADLPFQPGENFGVSITGGADLAAATLITPAPMPPFLSDLSAPAELLRGEDFVINWTPEPGQTVIAVLFDISPTAILPEPAIVCEISSDAGTLVVPGSLTETLDPEFDFELQIGHGFRQLIPGTELFVELVNGDVAAGNIR